MVIAADCRVHIYPARDRWRHALLRCISAIEAVKKRKANEGCNAATREYEVLVWASVVGLLPTTERLITDIPEKDKPAPMPGGGGGGMGGMGGMDY